jgi:hypothetical protein
MGDQRAAARTAAKRRRSSFWDSPNDDDLKVRNEIPFQDIADPLLMVT